MHGVVHIYLSIYLTIYLPYLPPLFIHQSSINHPSIHPSTLITLLHSFINKTTSMHLYTSSLHLNHIYSSIIIHDYTLNHLCIQYIHQSINQYTHIHTYINLIILISLHLMPSKLSIITPLIETYNQPTSIDNVNCKYLPQATDLSQKEVR